MNDTFTIHYLTNHEGGKKYKLALTGVAHLSIVPCTKRSLIQFPIRAMPGLLAGFLVGGVQEIADGCVSH